MLGALYDPTRDQSLTCGKQGTPHQSPSPKNSHTHVLILKPVGSACLLQETIILSTCLRRDTLPQADRRCFCGSVWRNGMLVSLRGNAAQQDMRQFAQGQVTEVV